MVQIKNIGEVRSKGKVLIYNLIKTPLPPRFFTKRKLRPPGIEIEATDNKYK